jgi:hypothetical protein
MTAKGQGVQRDKAHLGNKRRCAIQGQKAMDKRNPDIIIIKALKGIRIGEETGVIVDINRKTEWDSHILFVVALSLASNLYAIIHTNVIIVAVPPIGLAIVPAIRGEDTIPSETVVV